MSAPAASDATASDATDWVRSGERDPEHARDAEHRIPPGTFIPFCLREQMRAKGYEFSEGPRDGPGSKVMIDGFVAGPGMVAGEGLHDLHPLTAYAKGQGPDAPIPAEAPPVNGK